MKPVPFFLILLSLLFSSSLSQTAIGAVVPGNSQSPENQMVDMSAASGKEHSAFRGRQSMEEMLLFFDEEDLIVIATRQPQKLSDAPAIATIITAEMIRNMGARTIYDVVRRLPGFGVSITQMGNYQIEVRGLHDPATTKIRFMIDGHSIQDELTQSIPWIFESFSLENVKRIELIRGPASALYGTSAFAGIINVVTNRGDDVDGVKAGIGAGSFNSRNANIQTGGRSGDFEYAFFVNSFKTDGDKGYVAEDVVHLDGDTDFWRDQLEVAAKVNYQEWQLNSRYIKKERGPYIGLQSALNDESEMKLGQYFVELSYEPQIRGAVHVMARLFADKVTDFDQYWELVPEGVDPNFPEGMIAHDTAEMEAYGTEVHFDYQLAEYNLLTIGGTAERRRLYDARFYANFESDISSANFGDPLGSVQDVTETGNWIDDSKSKRNVWAIYLQDIWTLSDELELTLGLRHDEYSDFGGSTNPKIAAVWKFQENWNLKALYASAFKAPTFAELYITNNTSQLGNPDVEPETTDTYELSLSNEVTGNYGARLTYFNIHYDNMIKPDITGANMVTNVDGLTSEGMELEWKKYWGSGYTLYLNYTWQDVRYVNGNSRVEDVARYKGNMGGNLAITEHLNFNVNLFGTGNKPRKSGDTRDDLDGYLLTDVALVVSDYIPGLVIRGKINNLFNKRYYDPSLLGSTVSDYPREGRNYMVDLTYLF